MALYSHYWQHIQIRLSTLKLVEIKGTGSVPKEIVTKNFWPAATTFTLWAYQTLNRKKKSMQQWVKYPALPSSSPRTFAGGMQVLMCDLTLDDSRLCLGLKRNIYRKNPHYHMKGCQHKCMAPFELGGAKKLCIHNRVLWAEEKAICCVFHLSKGEESRNPGRPMGKERCFLWFSLEDLHPQCRSVVLSV